jgi:hypothetical protein
MIAKSRPLTVALLAALRAAHPSVGHATGAGLTAPYAVLYPAGTGPLGGPVGDPHADADSTAQLTCVGATAEQAEWLADLLRPVLLGPLTITGRRLMQSWLETSQPVRRDDDVTPALFYAVDQARYLTTPT